MTLLVEVDRLYETAVTDPGSINEQSMVDWAENIAASNELDRVGYKYLRRCMNISRRLAAFWLERPRDLEETRGVESHDESDEWRSRVDLAFGVKAWRPQLDLAQHVLESSPCEEVFRYVSGLFRLVNGEPYLDGLSYDEWSELRRNEYWE